jgi:hypothetical protein
MMGWAFVLDTVQDMKGMTQFSLVAHDIYFANYKGQGTGIPSALHCGLLDEYKERPYNNVFDIYYIVLINWEWSREILKMDS